MFPINPKIYQKHYKFVKHWNDIDGDLLHDNYNKVVKDF